MRMVCSSLCLMIECQLNAVSDLGNGTENERRSVFVDFVSLINHLCRDLITLGGPLSQWNALGLQDGLLLGSRCHGEFIGHCLLDLKHSHTSSPFYSALSILVCSIGLSLRRW